MTKWECESCNYLKCYDYEISLFFLRCVEQIESRYIYNYDYVWKLDILSELRFEKNDINLCEFVKDMDYKKICYRKLAIDYCDYNKKNNSKEELKMAESCLYTLEEFMIDYLYYFFGIPYSEKNILVKTIKIKQIEESKPNITSKWREQTEVVKVRTAQKWLRETALDIYNTCQITKIENKELLEFCHIKPYALCEGKEELDAIDFYNGFLLYSPYNQLLDKGYISFEDNGNIILSKEVNFALKGALYLNESISIDVHPKQEKYLKWHRENIFKG